MSYVDIDGQMYFRSRSYELVPQQMSLYVSREELEDAKKELIDLRRKKVELLNIIEEEKRERDERITAEELQAIMLPVEIVDRRIKELSYLISNARIVEKSFGVQQEEIETLVEDDTPIVERIPDGLFFIKDGVKVEAKPGNRTPFFAFVDGEYIGFNRLLLNGWMLVDDSGRRIETISEAWDISKKVYLRERTSYIQATKDKYPKAYAPWTADENEQLIELYSIQGKTIAEISENLGRTKRGVSMQIKRLLGIKRLPHRKKQKDLEEYSLNPISMTTINPSEIPDEQMPDYLDLIEQMEEWFKYVKSYAENQAVENGVVYEGYEVKTAYKSSFSDPQVIIETIREKYPDLFRSCVQLKSVSAIKKTLGEERFNSLIAEYVVTKEARTLVKSKQ